MVNIECDKTMSLFLFVSAHSYIYILFFALVSINLTEWLTVPAGP